MNALFQTFLKNRSGLLSALIQHIEISAISLIIAMLIAIPLAIYAIRHRKMANVLLQIAGILQTIPSLALLGLLIPVVGIGNVPAVIALVVYALLPIFQNTYVGLNGIDPSLEEAADAFGMSRWQKLVRVELPIAMPVLISGIRTATVLIIGTATLAALIGAGGLGTYILLGINRNEPMLTFIGALASAFLAIIFSLAIQLMQRLKPKTIGILIVCFIALIGGTTGYSKYEASKPTITIAGKLGSEPDILIQMYKDLIKQDAPNTKIQLKQNFGQTSFLFSALKSNQISIYPEFTGTVLESLVHTGVKGQGTSAAKTYQLAKQKLKKQYKMTYLKPMAYNNTYAVVVKQSFANQYHLKNISDLLKIENKLHGGFDLEFIDRNDGYKGLKKVYGLDFKKISMDADLRYQAIDQGKINVTDGYTTDAQLRQFNLVALHDDRNLFPTYQGAPLINAKTMKAYPKLAKSLNKLAGKITETQMQDMNYEVSVKHRSAAVVAHNYLVKNKLVKGDN